MPDSKRFLKPDILSRITKLGLRAGRLVEGTIAGQHRSPLHGVSPEFAEYREYAPGDDPKNLDWRAYARSGRYFIKRFEEDSNLRATLVLDASASMRYQSERPGAVSKLEYGAVLAASLASLLLRQRDAAGLVTMDTETRTEMRPSANARQLHKILTTLDAIEPDGKTELGDLIWNLSDRLHRRGMVVLISDLLTDLDPLYAALGKLLHNDQEVILLHVLDPDEIELPFKHSVMFKDIEGDEQLFAEPWAFRKAYKREMERFIDDVRTRCRSCGMDYLLMRTDEDAGLALSHYLHERLRRGPAKYHGRMNSGSDPASNADDPQAQSAEAPA